MNKKLFGKLKIVLITIPTFIFLFIGCGIKDNQKVIDSEIQIDIERMEHSIINSNGKHVGVIYYDKPLIKGNDSVAININNFFEGEYQKWLSGTSRLNYFQDNGITNFVSRLEDIRKYWGEDVLEASPFYYTVDTEIILLTEHILSIKQVVYSYTDTSSSESYFGSTFNLQTGQLMSFDEITEVDKIVFCENLYTYLIEAYGLEEDESNKNYILDHYKLDEEGNYPSDIIYGGEYKLNFEYYYDGEYFYIPEKLYPYVVGTELIIKWNGKAGDEFEAELLGLP